MDLISSPTTALSGEIYLPGDKSISHRALIMSAIAEGRTTIYGLLESEDCVATRSALMAMGVKMEEPSPGVLWVHGRGKYGLEAPVQAIDCGNSGTSLRLLTGLLAAQPFSSILTGDSSLLNRPMERLTGPLTQMGAMIETNHGKAPIKIHAVKGQASALRGIRYKMPVASAQVKSGLLIAGMYADAETQIIEPCILRDHTERMLASFSCPVHKSGHEIRIHPNRKCMGCHIEIPGDFSSAAFFIVAATLIPHSEIILKNVGINPTRTGLLVLLKQMGAQIEVFNKKLYGEEPVADIRVRHAPLEGISIPAAMVPLAIDEFPILFIAAAVAKGQTILHGARELKFKESDRLFAMATGLQTLGIDAHTSKDGLYIQGGALRGGVVHSFHDHRVAMAFAIAGAIAKDPVIIQDCRWINTSYPGFIETALSIKLAIEAMPHES